MTSARSPSRAAALLLCGLLLFGSPGCAALTGLATGAFTGAVDAPAQVYRKNRSTIDHHPEYWPFNVIFMAPIGFVFGPIAGFAKGLALDIQWLIGRTRYKRSFTTYRKPSVWRPYTIHW
jgi:hypothetical protein